MLNPWIRYCDIEPKDGEKVLAYIRIPDPENSLKCMRENHKWHKGKYLVGPMATTFHKEFTDKGHHNPIEYWQPIEALPD